MGHSYLEQKNTGTQLFREKNIETHLFRAKIYLGTVIQNWDTAILSQKIVRNSYFEAKYRAVGWLKIGGVLFQ